MSIEAEVTYEKGVLKPDQPLPLDERQRVKITIHEGASRARENYGLIGWKGDPEVVRKIALDPEFGVQESP